MICIHEAGDHSPLGPRCSKYYDSVTQPVEYLALNQHVASSILARIISIVP